MRKQLRAISLLAGTAIGTGMLSLPIVLANFGIIWSLLLMIFFCWVTYVSAMARCELNIKSRADFNLKDVGLFFDCKISARLGDIFAKLLNFALLSAYIFGGSSMIMSFMTESCQFAHVAIAFACVVAVVFLCSSELIIKINNNAFVALFSIILFGIVCLAICAKIDSVPLCAENISNLKSWCTVLPVVFTSFGYQGSLHSLTKFVENDRKMIKNACLFGSIIPAILYVLWVICVIAIIFNSDQESFERMLMSPIEVSELIRILANITGISLIQYVVWIVSFLAIVTSIVGVGLALNDIIESELSHFIKNPKPRRLLSTITMMIPTTLVVTFVPNAFIRILSFAGIILSVIAIMIPIHILRRRVHAGILMDMKILSVFAVGMIIIVFGILDVFI